MINRVKGFKDILPTESQLFDFIEKTSREVFSVYNYKEIRIPTVEYYELFIKSTGQTTDIVQKEMYKFEDQSKRFLALRPEGTPGVVRAYLENALYLSGENTKFFYIGNMFRAERPQANRFREFEQIGVEYINTKSPYSDAEVIIMLDTIFKKLGIEKQYTIEINSIGCNQCKKNYRDNLISYLKNIDLCNICKERLGKNPLRILDCKIDKDKFTNIPEIKLCDECLKHKEEFERGLADSSIKFNQNKLLVRGLDYYTKTVFEFKMNTQSQQDAIAGGGRYDDLVSDMGGKYSPSVGWAFGVERVVSLLKKINFNIKKNKLIFVTTINQQFSKYCFDIVKKLRENNIKTDFSDFSKSLKSQLRDANSNNADYVFIIGDEEAKNNEITVKNLITKSQLKLKIEDFITKINSGDEI